MTEQFARNHQALLTEAHDMLQAASVDLVWSLDNGDEGIDLGFVDLDGAIMQAQRGLRALHDLRWLRDKEVTVNLSERSHDVVESASPVLATESPVIRSLPVTDKITPIVIRRPESLRSLSSVG